MKNVSLGITYYLHRKIHWKCHGHQLFDLFLLFQGLLIRSYVKLISHNAIYVPTTNSARSISIFFH